MEPMNRQNLPFRGTRHFTNTRERALTDGSHITVGHIDLRLFSYIIHCWTLSTPSSWSFFDSVLIANHSIFFFISSYLYSNVFPFDLRITSFHFSLSPSPFNFPFQSSSYPPKPRFSHLPLGFPLYLSRSVSHSDTFVIISLCALRFIWPHHLNRSIVKNLTTSSPSTNVATSWLFRFES